MTHDDIERRLQKLEAQIPRQPTEHEKTVERLRCLLRCAIAFYLGDPTEEESVMTAYARALGYPDSYECREAFEAEDSDLIERDRLARIKLLAKFGVSWDHEWDEVCDAFERMQAGLSEEYKRTLQD